MTDQAPALRLIEDRAAIADAIYAYTRAIRELDAVGAAALFTEDGKFTTREMNLFHPGDVTVRSTLTGRHEILDARRKTASSSIRVCPMIHNLEIHVDGDRAEARSVMRTVSFPAGYEVTGEYHDSLQRQDGQWRFAQRTYTIFKGDE